MIIGHVQPALGARTGCPCSLDHSPGAAGSAVRANGLSGTDIGPGCPAFGRTPIWSGLLHGVQEQLAEIEQIRDRMQSLLDAVLAVASGLELDATLAGAF
ncbi:hypothetical protein GCM10023320_62880 [Pseudonocardia adelaidensis]|uniref:Uncharacterized protein n=1 Tax=Pseudonocardia adelaidensis TaxID=648754 RepID=A0ABP9NUW0_9PSEU